MGIYPLQKGSFPTILRQKAAAGVSLAAASFLVLRRKPLFLKCFAVLPCRFFPAANSENAAMLGALQGRGGSCGEKVAGKTESTPMTNRLVRRALCPPDFSIDFFIGMGYCIFSLWRCIEVVVTRLTRNQLAGNTARGFESLHLRQKRTHICLR